MPNVGTDRVGRDEQTLRDRLSYRDMTDDDRKNYESQIVNFFLQTIPPNSYR